MERSEAEALLETLIDKLAAVEHERWAHWQRYLHSKGQRLTDGSLVLPAEMVQHWEKQIATSYASLSESDKISDRQQVRRYLPIIAAALTD